MALLLGYDVGSSSIKATLMEAETGKVVWVNDSTGAQYIRQPHSALSFGGVAPQGALVATEDYLLVPGGRSVPAAFRRDTGKLAYFHLNAGGIRVAVDQHGTGGKGILGVGLQQLPRATIQRAAMPHAIRRDLLPGPHRHPRHGLRSLAKIAGGRGGPDPLLDR